LFANDREEAITKASKDLEEPSGTGAEEAIVLSDPLRRPLLYAAHHDIHPSERVPEQWYDDVSNARSRIRQAVRSVGRIEVTNYPDPLGLVPPYGLGWVAGTGFMVAPGIVMTNRHVVSQFAQTTGDAGGKGWAFKENPPDAWDIGPAVVWINFGGTFDGQPVLRLRVEEVLHVIPENVGTDVALLRISVPEGAEPPPPIPLQSTTPSGDEIKRKVAVCGYPADPGQGQSYNPLLRRVGAYKAKRISLGEVTYLGEKPAKGPDRPTIYHDCSTLSGSSGSPMIDLVTGRVWAIHYWGREKVANYAEPMWAVLQDNQISRHLDVEAPAPPALVEPPEVSIPRRSDSVLDIITFSIRDEVLRGYLLNRGEDDVPEFMGADPKSFDDLQTSIPSVGHLSMERSAQTCFLVAPDVVITYVDANSLIESMTRNQMVVDFNRTVERAPDFSRFPDNTSFRVIDILYPRRGGAPPGVSTPALLRLEPRVREYPAKRLKLAVHNPGNGYDLRLMPALIGELDIPTEGKALVIVAKVQGNLHFRIFDAVGQRVVDTDAFQVPNKASEIAELNILLDGMWDRSPILVGDRDKIIDAVTSIVGHPSEFDPEEPVYTIGHPNPEPARMPNVEQPDSMELFEVIFPPPYGVKRVAWGRLMRVVEQERTMNLYHDCSTAPGDLGGPLIRWSTGEVIGVHVGGKSQQYNYAIPAWEFWQDPEFSSILTNAIENR
jgi:hypothetical protein